MNGPYNLNKEQQEEYEREVVDPWIYKQEIISIIKWLNEADYLKGWGAYEMPDAWYLTYDNPFPAPRSYWEL